MVTAEAEVKVALTNAEYASIPNCLLALGFTLQHAKDLTDYYLSREWSADGGWDYRRLRDTGGETCILTEKRWITDAAGHLVRLEAEEELPRVACTPLITDASPALTLRKHRDSYIGAIDGAPATIVLDALTLVDQVSYYLECEILTSPEQATEARVRIRTWLTDALALGDRPEAPSMLELLLGAAESGTRTIR